MAKLFDLKLRGVVLSFVIMLDLYKRLTYEVLSKCMKDIKYIVPCDNIVFSTWEKLFSPIPDVKSFY